MSGIKSFRCKVKVIQGELVVLIDSFQGVVSYYEIGRRIFDVVVGKWIVSVFKQFGLNISLDEVFLDDVVWDEV